MTVFSGFIQWQDLNANLTNPDWVVLDCRFDLLEPKWGREAYQEDHIPGAVYADLNVDLSGPVTPSTGRHPLPSVPSLVNFFKKAGVSNHSQVVTYDSSGGAMAAGRCWWLLRYLSHPAVAILDGGYPEWLRNGLPTNAQIPSPHPGDLSGRPISSMILTTQEIEMRVERHEKTLLDARATDRYTGRNEPIDRLGGHIPGAINLPYEGFLNPDQTIISPEKIIHKIRSRAGDLPIDQWGMYCGSGVTSAMTLAAMAYAGLALPSLYAGSWSEWILDPGHPIEVET